MGYIYNEERKDATVFTKEYNEALRKEWDQEKFQTELEDVAFAKQHLILELGEEDILDEQGTVIYDAKKYPVKHSGDFPDTVNPYLWQIRKDNEYAGVYKMAEGYYVVTGVEIAMIGFIRAEHGWIIVDAGSFVEAAALCMRLVEKAVGEKIEGNIVAVIYSHSHYDHFAGAEAFVLAEQVGKPEDGKIAVIAPDEYEQSLIDDNLYAGIAMSRRLQYQGGLFLPRDEKGTVSAGLNNSIGVYGHASMVLPNVYIKEEQTFTIDGIELTFIPSPNTETRAHMCVYSNTHKVLYLGDNGMGTVHNTYTPRGARVRDAGYWGELFYHLYTSFGDEVEAVFQGHGVAQFKRTDRSNNLKRYLLDNAAAYKFPSDQALLLANQGVKLNEIGRQIHIPDEIKRTWYTRDHYGNYTFNARGAVQRYLGFYDGNPVNLFPLEEAELARKLVEYIGSPELILEKAEADFEKGEYQWVAAITNHLVFLDSDNSRARYLCADALEQLGYQAHTGLWRNMYLSGAYELRHPQAAASRDLRIMDNKDVMPYVSASLILDYLGINFDGERAVQLEKKFILNVQPENERYLIYIYKGTVLHEKVSEEAAADDLAELTLTKKQLYEIASKQNTIERSGLSKQQNDILNILEKYVVDTDQYRNFNIIEPLR